MSETPNQGPPSNGGAPIHATAAGPPSMQANGPHSGGGGARAALGPDLGPTPAISAGHVAPLSPQQPTPARFSAAPLSPSLPNPATLGQAQSGQAQIQQHGLGVQGVGGQQLNNNNAQRFLSTSSVAGTPNPIPATLVQSQQPSAPIASISSVGHQQHQQQPIYLQSAQLPHPGPVSHVPQQPQPPPQLQQQQPSSSQTQEGAGRSLNVKDALSYLDQVKAQFQHQPDVYNRFLDIMKDFKSQSIDTPGVIERVSTLFRGHPTLVTGFNTFLPPGYRIEATMNPLDPIRVWTPAGLQPSRLQQQQQQQQPVAVSAPPPPLQQPSPNLPHYNATPPSHSGPPPQQQQPQSYYSGERQPSAQPPSQPIPQPHGQPHPGVQPQAYPAQAPIHLSMTQPMPHPQQQHVMVNTSGAPPPQQQQQPGGEGPKKTPVEFGQAITYVNKIKNRFANDPETYKQFLEILQTYQKESKPIQEVYAQVQVLFANAPDLLEEFKQFLPEVNEVIGAPPSGGRGGKGAPPATGTKYAMPVQGVPPVQRMPAVGTFAGGQGRGGGGVPVAQMQQQQQQQKLTKPKRGVFSAGGGAGGYSPQMQQQQQQHQQQPGGVPPLVAMQPVGMPMQVGGGAAGAPAMKKKRLDGAGTGRVGGYLPGAPLVPGVGVGVGQFPGDGQQVPQMGTMGGAPSGSLEELDWIDRCKRSIGNKATYNEFLKVLNLFSNEIIDAKTLVERVEPFLAKSPELFAWFKRFVKYEEEQVVYNFPADRPVVDWRTCKRVGYSYKSLPADVPRSTCSGRDDLCREVLNDDWIAQPEFVSETGFIAHKKTVYEEALHKCEEERYEFDMNIEANLHTIALLEPIYRRIQTMSPEDKSKFKLPVGLGGPSKTIYQRVVKKIYDVEKGLEVIDALHNNPAVAVPIVLKRLKQKDEEWKRCQREWNKVWREIDAKNWLKSLDHQGINFKAADRKAISSKTLTTEIETLYREQRERRSTALPLRSTPSAHYGFLSSSVLAPGPLTSTAFSRFQMDFVFPDVSVFKDARKLVMMTVGNTPALSQNDEDRIGDFLSNFLKRFFCLDGSVEIYGEEETGEDGGMNGNGGEEGSIAESADDVNGGVKSAQTLRKEVLMRQAAAFGAGSDVGTAMDVAMDVDSDTESASGRVTATYVRPVQKREYYPLFANSTLYIFFRLYEILCARLYKLKELSDQYQKNPPHHTNLLNPVATGLGVQQKDSLDASAPKSKDRYTDFLHAVHELFASNLEAGDFEDRMRNLFGTTAYLSYTIDKLVAAIVKQVQSVITDSVCMDLLELYFKDRQKLVSSSRQESVYRLNAERIVDDDNLYRLEYHVAPKVLTFQIISKEDPVIHEGSSVEEKWSVYVDQFIQLSSNAQGISLPRRGRVVNFPSNNGGIPGCEPFLRRNLPTQIAPGPLAGDTVEMRSGLELKICLNTYKMFFVEDTEDFFARRHVADAATALGKKRLGGWNVTSRIAGNGARKKKFDGWLGAREKAIAADEAEWVVLDKEAGVQAGSSSGAGVEQDGDVVMK
ncbi:hypothetical protein BC830DRAFT_1124114 [Chytriomyces sp. MP71]|nr:hypothetical protein BC830DRAFT_1124114 [Chytriomyces sp. MP71]